MPRASEGVQSRNIRTSGQNIGTIVLMCRPDVPNIIGTRGTYYTSRSPDDVHAHHWVFSLFQKLSRCSHCRGNANVTDSTNVERPAENRLHRLHRRAMN